jgi:hypothetical protein
LAGVGSEGVEEDGLELDRGVLDLTVSVDIGEADLAETLAIKEEGIELSAGDLGS